MYMRFPVLPFFDFSFALVTYLSPSFIFPAFVDKYTVNDKYMWASPSYSKKDTLFHHQFS